MLLHPDVYQIFMQAGWISYFKKLQRFNEVEVLEFSQNLIEEYSMVHRVRILVTEEIMVAVTGLLTRENDGLTEKHAFPKHKGFF